MANRTKDGWARWSYEQLLLRQPHVETAGLWQVGSMFIVHCPKLGEGLLADDGRPIEQWFRDNKAITTPIGLVAELPPGAESLEARSLRELVATAASPKTLRELLLDLSLLLPREFPRLWLTDSAGRIQVHVERPLDEAETGTLMTAYASLQLSPDLEILVSPKERSSSQGFRDLGGQGNLHLTPSRSLPESFPLKVKWLWEEDEQFWVDHRFQLFEEKQPDPRKVLPQGWTEPLSRCLVDAEAFPPRNIRNYLSLYEQVVLAMPQWHSYPQQLLALGLTEAELVELLRLGRVKLLLSKSVESYPPSLLEKVAEEAPESLLLSRRLAGATVADARRRMPLLYPPLSAHERHLVLRELVRATAAIHNPTARNVMEGVIGELKRFWTDSEYHLHYRGASTTLGIGIGPLAAVLYQRLKGENLFLEFSSAGRVVEWGAALNASLFPIHTETFSAEGHSSILASGVSD